MSSKVWESPFLERCFHTLVLARRVYAHLHAYETLFSFCNFSVVWMHKLLRVCLTCRRLYRWESQLWELMDKQWAVTDLVMFTEQLNSQWHNLRDFNAFYMKSKSDDVTQLPRKHKNSSLKHLGTADHKGSSFIMSCFTNTFIKFKYFNIWSYLKQQ